MRITISADGHAASTRITGPDGGILRDVSDIKLHIKDGIWYADLEVSPVRLDITADVLKVILGFPEHQQLSGLTLTFTPDQVRDMINNRLRVLSGGQKIGQLPNHG